MQKYTKWLKVLVTLPDDPKRVREQSKREFASMLGRDPESAKLQEEQSQKIHAAAVARLEEKGIPVLGKDGKSFDELMEEKMR